MKRVLILNMWNVYPPHSGGDHSVWGLAQAISKHANCTLAVVNEHRATPQRQNIDENLTLLELPASDNRKSLKSRLLAPSSIYGQTPIKRAIRFTHSHILSHALSEEIKSSDAVILCHPWLWPAAKIANAQHQKTIFYDAHNVEHLLINIWSNNPLKQMIFRAVTHNIERDLCKSALEVWCCTEDDARQFQSIQPGCNTLTGFKGRPKYNNEANGFNSRQNSAIFIGSDWPPNNEAATFIANKLAPSMPNCQFYLAGSCGKHISSPPPNLTILGYVENLDNEIIKHKVALNPVTSGSGINIKMFDYLATSTPVVSTSFGARGMPPDVKNQLTITQPEHFKQAIEALMHDEHNWNAQSRGLKQAFLDHYEWDAIGLKAFNRINAAIQND